MSSHRDLFADRGRAESFGAGAEAYERSRPGYPDALIDDVLAEKPADALDVGCGTGKAARPLVERGVEVLGIEPDERMAEIARGHGIPVEIGRFEEWDPKGRRFDLLVSGQAWHWVDPIRGPEKALEVLRPGGTLATFWNVAELPELVREQLDTVYERIAPEIDPYSVVRGCGRIPEPNGPIKVTLEGFATTDARRYEWEQSYERDAWLELILTHSDHSQLDDSRRAPLVTAVGEVIDAHGGSVTATYRTYAVVARAPR